MSEVSVFKLVGIVVGSIVLSAASINLLIELGNQVPTGTIDANFQGAAEESGTVKDNLGMSWAYDVVFYTSAIVGILGGLLALTTGICSFTKFKDKFSWVSSYITAMFWAGAVLIFLTGMLGMLMFHQTFLKGYQPGQNIVIPDKSWLQQSNLSWLLMGLSFTGFVISGIYSFPQVFGLELKQ